MPSESAAQNLDYTDIPANDNAESSRVLDGKNKTEAQKSAENGEMGKLIDIKAKIKEGSEEKRVRNLIYPIVEKVDASEVMSKVRSVWETMPYPAQWAFINIPTNPYAEVAKALIQTGLLEYKGATNDQELKAMNEWENIKLEWGVKIGKYFIPELAAIEPYVKPILEIKNIRDELFEDVRYHIREVRKVKEDQKKIAEIRSELLSSPSTT